GNPTRKTGEGRPPAAKTTRAAATGGTPRSGSALPPWMPDSGLLRAMKPRNTMEPAPAPASARRAPAPAAGGAGVPAGAGGKARGRPATGLVDPQADREAGRYDNPIPSREAILQVLSDADGPLDAERVQQVLGLDDPERAAALDKRMAAMLRD